MLFMSLLVAATLSADPCEAPRVRDTAPLAQAMAQDKVLGLTFTKAAGLCEQRGEACDAARLECATMLTNTIQKQVGFDEGQWLRDMLLPYNGTSYPMTRTFGAASIASDASCNVDVATLTAAGQRRMVQAQRRDNIYQEYGLYAKWTQVQLQKCREQAAANEARSAAAKAESERLAAASAALSAADAAKAKKLQEEAAAKAAAEQKAKDAAEAEARRQKEQKELAERELKRKEEAEQFAREEREKDRRAAEARALQAEETRKKERAETEEARKKERAEAEEQRRRDQAEAEAKAEKAKQEAALAAKAAEEKRLITERDTRVNQQRQLKAQLVADAEAVYKRAKDDELLKKQAAVDAVAMSPAVAQAAVAEAAQAEKVRVDAEKKLFDARQRAEAIVIDDSFERGSGSVLAAGGGSGLDTGFGLGALAGAHFGFWGTAPPEGMASGFEIRLWGRYLASVAGTATSTFDSLLTARYFFGRFAVGLAGELRLIDPAQSTAMAPAALRGGVGPALSAAFVDNHETRVIIGANYLPLGNTIDGARFVADFEVSYKFVTFHVIGGTASRAGGPLAWQVGGYLGLRASW